KTAFCVNLPRIFAQRFRHVGRTSSNKRPQTTDYLSATASSHSGNSASLLGSRDSRCLRRAYMSFGISDGRQSPLQKDRVHGAVESSILSGVEVMRKGRIEPFLNAHPCLSSSSVQWAGVALEDHSVPACVIDRHEHLENFIHVIVHGSVKYEVLTRGKV